jgi:DNA-binding protein HU-beta
MRCEPRNSVYSEQDYFRGSSDTMATQPATAAKPKVNTVSLKHLAAALAETHEMPKKQGEAILNDLVNLITKHLKKGDRIRLVGLGVLVVRKRAARMGRNPATGAKPGNNFAQPRSGWAMFFPGPLSRDQCSLAASSPVRFSRMN